MAFQIKISTALKTPVTLFKIYERFIYTPCSLFSLRPGDAESTIFTPPRRGKRYVYTLYTFYNTEAYVNRLTSGYSNTLEMIYIYPQSRKTMKKLSRQRKENRKTPRNVVIVRSEVPVRTPLSKNFSFRN